MMRRSLRYYYLKIVRQRGTPKQVAMGVATGVFIGVAVPPGCRMELAFAVAWIMGWSRVAAVVSTWISNPLTMPVFIAIQVEIGRFLVGVPKATVTPATDMNSVWDFFIFFFHRVVAHRNLLPAWSVGALITGVVSATASYFIARSGVIAYRRRKQERRARKAQQAARVSTSGASHHPSAH